MKMKGQALIYEFGRLREIEGTMDALVSYLERSKYPDIDVVRHIVGVSVPEEKDTEHV